MLQAISSPTHHIPAIACSTFNRPIYEYQGIKHIQTRGDPLFVYQYSHAWFDFHNKKDQFTNYFENSKIATQAHKLWSTTALNSNFSIYTENYWSILALPYGYDAWSRPPGRGITDGSVVPYAAAGSMKIWLF